MTIATESNLKPFPGRILVREDTFKYDGIIEIPDKAKRRPQTGVVIAVGLNVAYPNVGQHILYAQFSGTGIQIRNQPAFRVLSPEECLLEIVGDAEVEEVSA